MSEWAESGIGVIENESNCFWLSWWSLLHCAADSVGGKGLALGGWESYCMALGLPWLDVLAFRCTQTVRLEIGNAGVWGSRSLIRSSRLPGLRADLVTLSGSLTQHCVSALCHDLCYRISGRKPQSLGRANMTLLFSIELCSGELQALSGNVSYPTQRGITVLFGNVSAPLVPPPGTIEQRHPPRWLHVKAQWGLEASGGKCPDDGSRQCFGGRCPCCVALFDWPFLPLDDFVLIAPLLSPAWRPGDVSSALAYSHHDPPPPTPHPPPSTHPPTSQSPPPSLTKGKWTPATSFHMLPL